MHTLYENLDDIKIVFLDAATLTNGDIDMSRLYELGDLTIYDRTTADQLEERCAEAEIIITNKVVLTGEHMAQFEDLGYICVAATGYNNIDIAAAKKIGIPVSNVSGYSTTGVVQHTFALLLEALHQVGQYSAEVRAGSWQSAPDFSYYHHSISELSGKTMGIFGLGTIGQQVADVALAFGMDVIATSRNPERDAKPGVRFVRVEELFAQADVVSLHAPLNDSTKGMVNYDLLSTMKPSAILVNTARGPLIVEQDLAKALQEGKLAWACLDVLSQEPPSVDNLLIGMPNAIITPHQAWASKESRQRLLDGIVRNLTSYIYGTVLENRVG